MNYSNLVKKFIVNENSLNVNELNYLLDHFKIKGVKSTLNKEDKRYILDRAINYSKKENLKKLAQLKIKVRKGSTIFTILNLLAKQLIKSTRLIKKVKKYEQNIKEFKPKREIKTPYLNLKQAVYAKLRARREVRDLNELTQLKNNVITQHPIYDVLNYFTKLGLVYTKNKPGVEANEGDYFIYDIEQSQDVIDALIAKYGTYKPLELLLSNKYYKYVDEHIASLIIDPNDINNVIPGVMSIIRSAHEALYNEHSNVKQAFIKVFYVGINLISGGGGYELRFRYEKQAHPFLKNTNIDNIKWSLEQKDSYDSYIYLGYRIIVDSTTKDKEGNNRQINDNTIYRLKAFNPSSNRKFHNYTTASTGNSRLCIYETYNDVTNKVCLKYARHINKTVTKLQDLLLEQGLEVEINDDGQLKDYQLISALKILAEIYEHAPLNKEFNKIRKLLCSKYRLITEGPEIVKTVKAGELIKSLELLTKKYNDEVTILFYNDKPKYEIDDDNYELINKEPLPINVNKGISSEIERLTLENDEDLDIILYSESDQHCAPSKYTINLNKQLQIRKKIIKKFSLKAIHTTKNNKPQIINVIGFDAETHPDANKYSVPYNITVYGDNVTTNKKDKIEKSLYGVKCLDEFMNFIDSITVKIDHTRARKKEATPYYYMYGFNNSNFDNLLIYRKLFAKDKRTKYCFTGNAIKYIRYNNIRIFDIKLQYSTGTLRDTCAKFKLPIQKSVYPYKFVTADNIYYKGPVPEPKYWNNKNEYDEYVKENGFTIDLKEYTEKYCMLDSKLVYELAKLHIKSCVGEINGRHYNLIDCPTSANLSLKFLKQAFLKEDLYQSPDDIVAKERRAYEGGRTQAFKREYNHKTSSSQFLYYYDINSAHPHSMTLQMPYECLGSEEFTEPIPADLDTLEPCNLYCAKSEYNGSGFVIPNLLIKKDNNIIAIKNTDYEYHWGCELIEAVKNGFEITIKEVIRYNTLDCFKEFIEYCYKQRLIYKDKKTLNDALSLFFKNVMNGSYGKFGQRQFTNSKLFDSVETMYNFLSGDNRILINFIILNDDSIMLEYKESADEYAIGKLVRFSSYISAQTRCKLSEFMRDVGHENVYYCDTDSVFTTKKPSDYLIDNAKLGKWKCEHDDIIEAVFLAPKTYSFKTNKDLTYKKAKGLRQEDIEYDEFKKLLDGNIKTISQKRDMFFRSYNGVIIEPVTRNIRPVYNKTMWNGNDSIAYDTIEDWEDNKNNKDN